MQLGDMQATAVAHNHLAVAHQKLADQLVATASSSVLPTAAQVCANIPSRLDCGSHGAVHQHHHQHHHLRTH